jgi:phosphoglycolate phosphatase-like HAD superfamily hydrolase
LLDRIECVYLIGSEASTLVKIGRSVDVQARLAALQTMSPVPLTLLWQTLGGAELEAALHRHFDPRRRHGEWFDFPDGDAIACVVQALPEVAAEMQRVQREQVAQAARQAKAAKAAAVKTEQPDRDTVARQIYDEYIAEHDEAPAVAELMRHLKAAGYPTGNRTAAKLLNDWSDHPLRIAN